MKPYIIVACLGVCLPTLVHAAQQCSMPPDTAAFAVADNFGGSEQKVVQVSAGPASPSPR